jgi:hypothetical protein
MTMPANLILSAGTQVVSRVPAKPCGGGPPEPAGAVGVIVTAPADATHAYHIRFVNGSEARLRRGEFSLLKEFKKEGLLPAHQAEFAEWQDFVIYRCIVGSQAFGLATDSSDVDRRGIYLPPAELHWSLYGVPEQLEHPATQECYWELRKFLVMALKANPNILECLWTPMVEYASPLAQELRKRRQVFLSKMVYQTYNGYVLSQFKKLEQDLRARGEIKWKHAMHLLRLLLSGITALKTGEILVQIPSQRDQLLAIKDGKVPWPEINTWRLELHREFDVAFAGTKLPARPDYEWANAFLIKARKAQFQGGPPPH